MRRTSFQISFIAGIVATSIVCVSAAVDPNKSFQTFGALVDSFTTNVIDSLGFMAKAIAVVAFFFGMVKYIYGLREGNGEKTKIGNQFMIWGLVALFVMYSVTGIIFLTQKIFGIEGMSNPTKLFLGDGTRDPLPADSPSLSPFSNTTLSPNGSVNYSAGGGNSGANVNFSSGNGGGTNGGSAVGVGMSVGGVQVDSSGLNVNGVPASQVPGVVNCNGRQVGAWCGFGMECALANDSSIACFRTVDINNGKAQTNAQAAVAPPAGASFGPTEADIPASSKPNYVCSPGYDCRTPSGTDGICSSDGSACESNSIYSQPVTEANYSPTNDCDNFSCD